MAKQKFRFAELYRNNKKAIVDALTSMWCGETKNESQKAYQEQLKKIISEMFAPENTAPMVQCMNTYEEAKDPVAAKNLLKGLWKDSYNPYQHQHVCWETLLNGKETIDGEELPKSIVVTTGTGSGKTECFMMPLVRDLIDDNVNGVKEQVQAIFLYPLNALMEDQKERLEQLLEGTDLKYAVYNGDLPEKEDVDDEIVTRKIESIRGIERDKNGDLIKDANGNVIVNFPHAIATRDELRNHPANILLTNPTMLEYILLRKADEKLVNPSLHSLKWIAIDETHTYTGAGAAEIAMLLRRVLMAYGVSTKTVRFATSSATIGDCKPGEESDELKQFIAGITGLNVKQIKHVDGERKGIKSIPHNEDEKYWMRIVNPDKSYEKNVDGYVSLNDLFDYPATVEEKLERLDEMCDRVEELDLKDLRVKVHYFYRVPNHGLFVDLSQRMDGCFKILTENRPASLIGNAPLLELNRCKHCGEYVAIAETVGSDEYQPLTMDDSDMFDLEATPDGKSKYMVFGISKETLRLGDGNCSYIIDGNKYRTLLSSERADGWRVIGNTQCSCPYCGTKLTRTYKNEIGEEYDEEDNKKLSKFRVSSDFVSRKIAPSTLELMTKNKVDVDKLGLHDGQQYISFVDSRQTAARATISQNLEEERNWVYAKIFHELCRLNAELPKIKLEIANQTRLAQEALMAGDTEKMTAYMEKIKELKASGKNYLTWKDITQLLSDDPVSDIFCMQFAERSELSKEIKNGKLLPETKKKYIQSIMVGYLAGRPLSAAAPETMGLFVSHYEKIEKALVDDLPCEVVAFNDSLRDKSNGIDKAAWHSLMKIFLDFTVRSNQSVYLKLDDHDEMDIFKCVRFATKKESRRPVNKPEIIEKQANSSRIIRLIAQLLAKDKHIDLSDAIKNGKDIIQSVIDCMWKTLREDYQVLNRSTTYDEEYKIHKEDKDELYKGKMGEPIRLNLADLSFKLYEEINLCDTNVSADVFHVECLRPVDCLFKGYSPYLIGSKPVLVDKNYVDNWCAYPYYKDSGLTQTEEELKQWASINRKLFFDNQLWGKYGLFADRVEEVYMFPKLFIQAEHTAQVDKMIARSVQKDFKGHAINILACSTTMEMGVNLGSLELVMLTSVPPHPSNYKQRAGRSGRMGQVRSACVTLCGSDAVGMRTLNNPMDSIIGKPVKNPTVDLSSAQVIQRHINSFLVREFGVFDESEHGGSISQTVLDYYTPYVFDGNIIMTKVDNDHIAPKDIFNDSTGSPYETFNIKCSKTVAPVLRVKIEELLKDTVFAGGDNVDVVVTNALNDNIKCYEQLKKKVGQIVAFYMKATSPKQKDFFTIKYLEPLKAQLLAHWATNRFTPNANMPVNIIQFDVNASTKTGYSANRVSNPSYPLRTALQQYAPGNPIARDGMVRIVRGVRCTDFFNPQVSLKCLYRNDTQVVFDCKDEIDNLKKWSVSDDLGLMLLQPAEFIPDMFESANRILDKNSYTRVDAQLIGANEWEDTTDHHLFGLRNNNEDENGRILYYNEGKGYGYCHCIKCGRTVLETQLATKDPDIYPEGMNTVAGKDDKMYHFDMKGKGGRPQICIGCSKDYDGIKRNVVIGDTIQTDYTEIRIRRADKGWIKNRMSCQDLLITLGMLFTQALSDELNVEREDLDFTITPNGHICIFDSNPGGSGYANQLASMDLMKDVIDAALKIVEIAESVGSKDALINRSTLHYINNIDIKAAKEWLKEEIKAREVLPANVIRVFGDKAIETSLFKLKTAFASSVTESFIFFNNDYKTWNYGEATNGWRGRLLKDFVTRGSHTSIVILDNDGKVIPEPIKSVVSKIDAWAKDIVSCKNSFMSDEIYPIAYIDGKLFFAVNKENTCLNESWANGTLFSVKTDNPANGAKKVDYSPLPSTKVFFIDDTSGYTKIKTNELGEIIDKLSGGVIDAFVKHCASCNDTLQVLYQDDYLRSPLSILFSLQTIGYFLLKIGKEFDVDFWMEKYIDDFTRAGLIGPMPNSSERNRLLTRLTDEWILDLKNIDNCVEGHHEQFKSKEHNELTHWRVLVLECGGKRLSIYPDGGFLNGWSFYREPGVRTKFYDANSIEITDRICLMRNADIKYDVTIEDI